MSNNSFNRSEFQLVIQLFYEGKTELDYLQKFIGQQNKGTSVRLNKILINPNPIHLVQQAIKKFNDLKTKKSEIWVIFDDDKRHEEIKSAIDLVKSSGKQIHIAFMKPCIELWPLLHNGINNVTTTSSAQSRLKTIMPNYDHERNPYFDLSKMPNYDDAVSKAKAWETSLYEEPEYNSSKFAGIYKLTEKIKEI